MTAETDIAAIDDGGENTAAEVRTALTSTLARADAGLVYAETLTINNLGIAAPASAGSATFSSVVVASGNYVGQQIFLMLTTPVGVMQGYKADQIIQFGIQYSINGGTSYVDFGRINYKDQGQGQDATDRFHINGRAGSGLVTPTGALQIRAALQWQSGGVSGALLEGAFATMTVFT